MKKLMKAFLFGAVMLEAVSLMGAQFRVDLQVQKDACGLAADGGSEGVSIKNASWKKDKADCRLVITGSSGENWEEKWIQFIPAEDCVVAVYLMSPSSEDNVAFDNVRIKGASSRNASFEALDSNGNPRGWYGKYILKSTDAADGEKYIEVSHNGRAFQAIKCKKGQPVKITFMVRDVKR